MRAFDCVYEGKRYPVMASSHIAARSLGTRHIANLLGAIVPSKVAVVDLEVAAGYKPTRYLNVTEGLSHVVNLPLPPMTDGERTYVENSERRVSARRSRVDQAMDRREANVRALQAKLCVCIAGASNSDVSNLAFCTCKSYERASWQIASDAFDMKLANAHLDGLVLDR